jgi:hypothetical protein
MPIDPKTGEYIDPKVIQSYFDMGGDYRNAPLRPGKYGGIASGLEGLFGGIFTGRGMSAAQGNQRFSDAAMQRALGANDLTGVYQALAAGSPEQKKSALSLMLQEKDPARRMEMEMKKRARAQARQTDPLALQEMQEKIAAAKSKRERDDAFTRLLQGQEPPTALPPQSGSALPLPPVGQTPVPGISVSPLQRTGGADGVMPGGVTPAQFTPSQPTPAPDAAPKQDDMVNTPWGRMSRERARKIGGAALLIPGKEEMGKVLLEYAKGGPDALGKEARNEVDKKEINTGEYIARLNSIRTKFDPSFQQIENRLGLKWAEWMDSFKAGQKAVSPEQRQSLAKFSQYRQEALANMNQYIKEITGAAMTDAEAKRIIAALPNPGQGLFDGDSPTVFKAKLDNALKSSQLAVVRYRYLRSNGFSGPIDQSNFSLDNMQAVIEKRGAELEQGIRQQMPKIDPQSLQGEVAARLRKEFGLDI